MIRTPRRVFSASAAALGLATLAVLAPLSQAASISYGNFGPVAPGISFLDVTESSATDTVPLYGAPVPYVTGLDFDPKTFVAFGVNGGGDITDGQMNFTIAGQVVNGNVTSISSVSLSEAGDYTLVGTGTAATQVQAGAIMSVKITEIDGIAVTPINLAPVNASVAYNLIANSGLAQPWSVALMVDVEAQLNSLAIPFIVGATKAEVVLNNTLTAISEPSSIAFIAKKDFVIGVVPDDGVIPEPSTLALAGLALCGIGVTSRRRIG